MRCKLHLLMVGALWGMAAPAAAQGPGLIIGRVVDTAALPVSGAEVRVVAAASGETHTAFSDGAGEWSMRFNAPSDRYLVVVRAVGLSPARFAVNGGSGTAVADVQLGPILLMAPRAMARP